MLTDAAIKALRPQRKIYKVSDRDGMYVRVMPSGAISFRLDLSPERAARDRLPSGSTGATGSHSPALANSASMQGEPSAKGGRLRLRSSARSGGLKKPRASVNSGRSGSLMRRWPTARGP